MKHYFSKMAGKGQSQKIPSIAEMLWSFLGAFIGISLLYYLVLDSIAQYVLNSDINYIIGSFGASAVLIYAAVDSPYAQPRNLVGGHIISALVGVFSYQMFSTELWLAATIAVSSSIVIMQLTKTLHPPGGATALIAVIGSPQLHELGYSYALFPVARGAIILLIVALIINNLSKNRQYPKHWL